MLTVVIAVLAGAVVGLVAPAAIDRIPAGRFPILGEFTRPHGAIDWAIVAAVAGTWGVLAGASGAEPELPAYLYLGWAGVVLAVIDLRHHRLPDALVLPSYPIALSLLGVAAIAESVGGTLARALAGAVLLAGFYYLLAFLRPGDIGLGDVKLAGLSGLYLGWTGWNELVVATAVAFVSAALLAVVLMATGRARRSSRIPFGPFMLVGGLLGVALGM